MALPITQKNVPAQAAIVAKGRLSGVPEIPEFAKTKIEPLYKKAAELGLEIVGPLAFVYHWYEGGAMDLRITIPIREAKGDAAPFEFYTTTPATMSSTIYKGPMSKIGEAWDTFVKAVPCEQTTNEFREIYLEWKEPESAENVTELQRVLK